MMVKKVTALVAPKKKLWFERAVETDNYHRERCKQNKDQTLRDTAKELERSYGSVQADVKLSDWIRSFPRIAEMKTVLEAQAYIKAKEDERKYR